MHFAQLRRLRKIGNILISALGLSVMANGATPPTTAEIMSRVVQRAEEAERQGAAGKYSYDKRAVMEELDATGKPVKTREKSYEVIPIDGVPFSRLIRIQNQPLTPEEREKQNRKEQEFRERLVRDPHSKRDKDDWLDVRLAERYEFKFEGRETLAGRAMWILSFQPKRPLRPETTAEDKVLNRLAGKLWIDEQEAEVAKLAVGLTEDLSLGWFGMIGSLKRCDLEMERERLADGTWMTQTQSLLLIGRKVFTSMRLRTREESSHFRLP